MGCRVAAMSKIDVGSGVLFASDGYLIDYNHKWDNDGVSVNEFKFKPIEIGNKSWFGLRAVVLAGAKVGKGVVVGAQEVVRGDVPDHSLVLGGEIKKNTDLHFSEKHKGCKEMEDQRK